MSQGDRQLSFLEFFSQQIKQPQSPAHRSKKESSRTSPQLQKSTSVLETVDTMQPKESESYLKMFRSLSHHGPIHNNNITPSTHVQSQNVQQKFRIDDIVSLSHEIQSYQSFYFKETVDRGLIKEPAFYVFNFSNNFENDMCISILQDFNKKEHQELVPKGFTFESYANQIHNSHSNHKSSLKRLQSYKSESNNQSRNEHLTVKTVQIDAQVDTSHLQPLTKQISEVNSKQKSLVKQSSNHQLRSSEVDRDDNRSEYPVKMLELLHLQIQTERTRNPRAEDYLQTMEAKLMQFLEYVMGEDKDFRGMANEQKIKQVLTGISAFKGKLIDGELKTLQLQYFFNELKQLKKVRDHQEKQQAEAERERIKEELLKGREKVPQRASKIDQNPPALIAIKQKKNTAKKTEPRKEPRTFKPSAPAPRTPVSKKSINHNIWIGKQLDF